MTDKSAHSARAQGSRSRQAQTEPSAAFMRGGTYEIRVEGHLDEHWSVWLGGLSICLESQGNTVLSGAIRDQAALHGILLKIRDLGLPLISLNRLTGA